MAGGKSSLGQLPNGITISSNLLCRCFLYPTRGQLSKDQQIGGIEAVAKSITTESKRSTLYILGKSKRHSNVHRGRKLHVPRDDKVGPLAHLAHGFLSLRNLYPVLSVI